MAKILWATLLLSLLCLLATGRDIVLDNNGRYNEILVSISENIPEDWSLVQKIKDSFQEASQRLAVASRINGSRSFAFGHVYILVPRSWSNVSVDSPATYHSEDVAHFRVDQRGNKIPNTVQPGDCGQPGLYVNLHRDHLRDTSAADLGKQLLHEFAHLRWGVFNEFNGDSGPHAYLQDGRISPVRCSASIAGKFGHKDTGLPCRVDRVTLQLDPDCRYILDEQGQTAAGCLMYTTYLTSVRQFCQAPAGNPDLDHNAAAPNPHNRRCGGRSVQSVMLDHADYRRAINSTETDTTVRFTVVQRAESRRLVIVMDVSGSMQGEPIAKMKIAVRSLLLGLLEDGIRCAMTKFSSAPSTVRGLSALSSAAIRQDYWRAVTQLSAGGSTAIGDALAQAMEILGANMNRPSKQDTGYIVLLTDGAENVKNRYSLAQATAIAAQTSIVVDTVAFGSSADKQLADLSAKTGGKAYFARFNSPANDLMEAMSDLVRDRVSTSQKPIDVFSMPVPSTFTEKVHLDASISNGAQFTLSSPAVADIRNADLRVISPTGVVYSSLNGSNYHRDDTNGIVNIGTDGKIESGDWTIQGVRKTLLLRSPEPSNNRLSLVVTSRPADSSPIILDGFVSPAKLELNANSRVSVFATLSQGSLLLTGANITATVESDAGVHAELRLHDDGTGADAVKGDGVFSSYVPTTVNEKREYNVRLASNQPVSRVSTAGKFEVTSIDQSSLNRTPPAKIGDLLARISLGGSGADVRLDFTAVGARRMEGSASQYILWLCANPTDLTSGSPPSSSNPNCESKLLLNASNPSLVVAGTPLSFPVPPNALAGRTGTVYLAVVAQNSDRVLGQLSNVVSVQTSLPDNLDEIERVGEGGGGMSTIAIVLIAIGAGLAVALIIGVGIFLILKKKNRGRVV